MGHVTVGILLETKN